MDRSIRAGISGSLMAVVINLFSPVYLDFIPSFLAAILAVYIYRLREPKDSLVAAFMTYIFSQGVLGTLGLATFYLANEPYELTVDIWLIFSPILTSITALIAGYVGVWLVKRTKPSEELTPPLPPPLPPV